MQAEEKNQGTGDRSEEGAIPLEKCADGAGGGPEGDEDHGETGDEGERRGEKSGAGLLALAELLDSDAGEHGDVAGNEREHAGREKGNQASQESSEEGDVGHSRSVLACVETSFGIFTLHSLLRQVRVCGFAAAANGLDHKALAGATQLVVAHCMQRVTRGATLYCPTKLCESSRLAFADARPCGGART